MKQVSSGLEAIWFFKFVRPVIACKLGKILMHKVWV